MSATHDPSPTRGRHATRCNAGQGPVGGRLRVRWGPRGPGGSSVTEPERPGRSRRPLRATCKLVPTAKILPRARHSCAYARRRPALPSRLSYAATHHRQRNWSARNLLKLLNSSTEFKVPLAVGPSGHRVFLWGFDFLNCENWLFDFCHASQSRKIINRKLKNQFLVIIMNRPSLKEYDAYRLS